MLDFEKLVHGVSITPTGVLLIKTPPLRSRSGSKIWICRGVFIRFRWKSEFDRGVFIRFRSDPELFWTPFWPFPPCKSLFWRSKIAKIFGLRPAQKSEFAGGVLLGFAENLNLTGGVLVRGGGFINNTPVVHWYFWTVFINIISLTFV